MTRGGARHGLIGLLAIVGLLAFIAAGCGGGGGGTPKSGGTSSGQGSGSSSSSSSSGQTSGATAAPADWAQWGNNLQHTFYSTLSGINSSNVKQLGIAWSASQGPNLTSWETYPVVIGGTMYYTTSSDQVIAADATNGHVKWRYTPKVNFYLAVAGGGGGVPENRGVTVANGKVYLVTFDDKLIALQQSTGEKLWQSQVADPHQGYSETSPAVYWGGKLYVGSAESDAGLRGFVAAYDANSGKQVWRYWTVPAAGHGWMPKNGAHGGGDVWMPVTVDPKSSTVYVGTGNPSPDLTNKNRPGCNRWVDATVALDANTGKLKWGHTEVCPDLWDYDSMPSPAVFDINKGGKTVHAVGHANKGGYYWIFDAASGKPLSKTQANLHQSNPRPHPSPKGVKVCPGATGGIEYTPAAFSPKTQMVYQPALDECMIMTTESEAQTALHKAGQVDFGGSIAPAPKSKPSGVMTAIDAGTGKVAWKHKLSSPMIGGALATAGGLVFSGSEDGNLYAFDAKTGKILWKGDAGLPFGAAPIAYSVNGTEYIAIAAGGSSVSTTFGSETGGQLIVLKVGGNQMHKFKPVKPKSTPQHELPNLAEYKQVGKWMYVDAARKDVVFKATAGATPKNNGFSYDGYAKGKAHFEVPIGWNATFEFSNKQHTPHSLEITKSIKGQPKPVTLPGALAPAMTPDPTKGVGTGITQVVSVNPRSPGKFYLACGVPGHIQSGMWDYFVVSKTAKSPRLVTG